MLTLIGLLLIVIGLYMAADNGGENSVIYAGLIIASIGGGLLA